MNTTDLKEKNFEADIERYLITEGGYIKGNQDTYDKDRAIDMPVLISFIEKTQPKQWKRYVTKYGDKAEKQLYRVFQDDVSRYGLIYVLRKGISDVGINIRFCYFAPASMLNDELVANYDANILTVTRQFAYSKLNKNTIDMVLSLNGIPVVALELKNQITGQNVEDSKRQWCTDRDPKEPLFHFNNRILAYFGVDLYEVALTTELKKEKTFFIPFNQGSNGAGEVGGAGNPEREDGGYVTAYLWEKVLRRDMLLSILQRYISRQEEEKLKIIIDKHGREKEITETSVKIIFPRYHQLDVVEKLVADTYFSNVLQSRCKEEARYDMAADEKTKYYSLKKPHGNNYLIQHSAGSGKSNSIAWLTYRLAGLQNAEMKNMFNSVFVITDRRVLNKQLQSTILGFDHIDGQIETITDSDNSEKLARIINDDNTRIVITTLHRFPVIYKELTSRSGKRYAIIVDEAHSSQSGKSAEKLKAALADTDEALREYAEIEEIEAEELEKKKDALMEDLLAQGQHNNLYFYAFTATPKPKTLQTFGELAEEGENPEDNRYVAYHNYSMLQAIEEGFIKDVLKYYTTYETTYEIAKRIEADPSYEETPATRAIKAFHDNHQHVIAQKTAIIVEKFREVTLNAILGKAKAMVVCSSRAHAVRYFLEIKRYCQENNITDVNPMVAFSGTVSYEGVEYTETKLNSTDGRNISEAKLPLYFASDLYNMLVVADKYQTGFDEPLLHTMFVDKKLKDVKAVQTLSRLNRWQKDKKDTYVLDFCNKPEDIKKSFEPFYKGTELIKPVDVNYVYTFRKDIQMFQLWTEGDEQKFYDLLQNISKQKDRLGVLSNAFKSTISRYEELDEEKRFEVRSKIKNFVRFYSYMAQIARTFDKELYKAYVYADYLYRLLPKNPKERIDLNKQIMLVNSKISEGETVSIQMEGTVKPLKGENPKAGKPKNDNEDLLSRIIDKVNIMYQGEFSEADRVIVESIYDKMVTTAKKKLTKQANNTDEKQFEESIFPQIFDEVARGCYVEQMDSFAKLFENSDFYRNVMTQMARVMYENYKKKEDEIPFIPELFKQKLLSDVESEFVDLKQFLSDFNSVTSCFINVLKAQTTSSIDGANELLLDSFNRLYCLEGMKLVDKRRHFNTIVTKYEVFLKKVYYLLNGKEIFCRGVSIHEEMPYGMSGRAYSEEQARVLLGWAKEMGCNFVRLAHYPHNEAMVRAAEEMGLLVWSEIPVYWTIQWENPETYANAESQLVDMITRDKNRANVVIWSVANETPHSDARLKFLSSLISKAREMDPTRLVSAAMEKSVVEKDLLTVHDELAELVDLISFNQYVGWYDGNSEKCDRVSWEFPVKKPVFISEFGAGAVYGRHGDRTERFTEEYMEDMYGRTVRMLERMPGLAGTTPWVLKDFRSPRRQMPEVQDDFNRKGLVSDQGGKKSGFYVMQRWYRKLASEAAAASDGRICLVWQEPASFPAAAAAQVQPADAAALEVVVQPVVEGGEEELHAGVFPDVLFVFGANGAGRLLPHAESEVQLVPGAAYVELHGGLVGIGVRPVHAAYGMCQRVFCDEHSVIDSSYSRYRGAASSSIDSGSPVGVMKAATISRATKAYFLPRRSSGRSTMPSIESRSIAEGNSNAIPMSSTSDENIDMYERRVAVLVMSGLML